MAYPFEGFRGDLEVLFREGLRTARLGWFRHLMFFFVRKPANWEEVNDQAVRSMTMSHQLNVGLLNAMYPFLSVQERAGASEISATRIRELADLAKIDGRDAGRLIELYHQFSDDEWRANLLENVAKARSAERYGFIAALWLIAVLGICAASLIWAIQKIAS